MTTEKRNVISVFLFEVAYSLFLVYSLIGHVEFLHAPLKKMTSVALVILCVNFAVQYNMCTRKEFIGYIALMMVALLTSFINKDYGLFKITLFAGSIRTINFKRLIKFDACLRICLIITIVALCMKEIVPDVVFMYEDTIRHSMGFTNPNALGTAVFVLICDILYISEMKLKVFNVLIISALALWLYQIARCRTAAVAIIALMMIAFVYSVYPGLFKKKMVKYTFFFLPIGLFILTFTVTYFYNQGNTWAIELNKFLSGRIEVVSIFTKVLSPKVFGQRIADTITTSLDNAYAFILLDLGIVITALFIAACIRSIHLNYVVGDVPLIIIIIAFLGYGLSEHLWINADYNIFVLALCYIPKLNEYREKVRYRETYFINKLGTRNKI